MNQNVKKYKIFIIHIRVYFWTLETRHLSKIKIQIEKITRLYFRALFSIEMPRFFFFFQKIFSKNWSKILKFQQTRAQEARFENISTKLQMNSCKTKPPTSVPIKVLSNMSAELHSWLSIYTSPHPHSNTIIFFFSFSIVSMNDSLIKIYSPGVHSSSQQYDYHVGVKLYWFVPRLKKKNWASVLKKLNKRGWLDEYLKKRNIFSFFLLPLDRTFVKKFC